MYLVVHLCKACFGAKTVSRCATALLVSLLGVSSSWAAQLALWNPSGTIDSNTPYAATSTLPGVTAGSLTKGSGLTNGGLFANAFMGDNWPSGALDLTDYLSFSVANSAPGSLITYQSVVFSLYNNFEGTGNWELRSSVDGFSSAIAAGTFSGIFASGLLVNANVSALGTRSGTVEFRLYTFNNAGAPTEFPLQRGIRGTGGSGQGLAVNGEISVAAAANTPVPTMGAWAAILLSGLLIAIGAFVTRWRNR
jgi:hypothetical protein